MSEQKNSAGSRRPLFVLVAIVAVVGATALYGRISGRASGGDHDLQDGCGGPVPAEQVGQPPAAPAVQAQAPAGNEAPDKPEKPETVVKVPEDVSTIQEAIDRIAEVGRVLIGPGTYQEEVRIAGKTVRLVGVARELPAPTGGPPTERPDLDALPTRSETEIVASSGAAVTFGPGGAGAVRDVVLRGGTRGIQALPEAGADPVGTLSVSGVDIRDTGIGIFGSLRELHVFDTEIIRPRADGVSLVGVPSVKLEGAVVIEAGGAGVRVDNRALPAGKFCLVEIEATVSGANRAEGIWIAGPHCEVAVEGGSLLENAQSGLTLWKVGHGEVTDTRIAAKQDGTNGILVQDSQVDLRESTVVNTQAALALLGCGKATVSKSKFEGNGLDMSVQAGSDCPTAPGIDDAGDNACTDKGGKARNCQTGRGPIGVPPPGPPALPLP